MAKPARLSNFFKILVGISIEVLVTLIMMAVMFIVGFIILKWFSR